MENNNTISSAGSLIQKGFFLYHECDCGGLHRKIFRKKALPGIEVTIYYPRGSQRFAITKWSKLVSQGDIAIFQTEVEKII